MRKKKLLTLRGQVKRLIDTYGSYGVVLQTSDSNPQHKIHGRPNIKVAEITDPFNTFDVNIF